MRVPPVAVAALLFIALAGCAQDEPAGAAVADEPADGMVRLAGVVVDEAIRPVAGARVELDGTTNATTDADGGFAFDVAPGAHVVRATKRGYADAVAQVDVRLGDERGVVKLALLTDVSSIPYAETYSIDGYVECGTYSGSYFAACGTGNVGFFIVCAQVNVCLGNVTGDRYIVIHWFDKTPTFLATETVWTSTQTFGDVLSVWLGSADREQLTFQPGNTPSVWNRSDGPSPLFVTVGSEDLVESGIGEDSWFLAQVFAGDEPTVPVELGLTVQQRFSMYLTLFYGYEPPADWRFSASGAPPPPPTIR